MQQLLIHQNLLKKVDTSKFAKKVVLASLKSHVDKYQLF